MALVHELIEDASVLSARVLKIKDKLSLGDIDDLGYDMKWFKQMSAARRRVYSHKKDLDKSAENLGYLAKSEEDGEGSKRFVEEQANILTAEKRLVWDTYEVFKIARRFGMERADV